MMACLRAAIVLPMAVAVASFLLSPQAMAQVATESFESHRYQAGVRAIATYQAIAE